MQPFYILVRNLKKFFIVQTDLCEIIPIMITSTTKKKTMATAKTKLRTKAKNKTTTDDKLDKTKQRITEK